MEIIQSPVWVLGNRLAFKWLEVGSEDHISLRERGVIELSLLQNEHQHHKRYSQQFTPGHD